MTPDRLPPPGFGEFWERVRVLCTLHRASITSAARTDKRNELVGGGPNSWHRLARGMLGADLVLDVMTEGNREALCRDARRLGMDAVDEGDHVHLEPSGG